jgi:hypothetical protein
LENIKDVM